MQPLKVFAMALVVALFIKKLEKQELERMEKEIDNVKEWFTYPTAPEEETETHINTGLFDRANTDHLLPPDMESLSKMRQFAYKQQKTKAIVKEIMYYLIYAVVIVLLGYSLRDYNAFYQTKGLENLFGLNDRFHKVC